MNIYICMHAYIHLRCASSLTPKKDFKDKNIDSQKEMHIQDFFLGKVF